MNLLLHNCSNGLPQLHNPIQYMGATIECEVVTKDMIEWKCLNAKPEEEIVIYTSTLFNIATDFGIALNCVYEWKQLRARTISVSDGFDSEKNWKEIITLMPFIESFKSAHNEYKRIRREKDNNGEECVTRSDKITYKSFSDFERNYKLFKEGLIKKNQWESEYGVSRPTLNRMISDYEEDNNISHSINEHQVEYNVSDFPDFERYYKMNKNKEISRINWAKTLNISRPTLSKLIWKYENGIFFMTEKDSGDKDAVRMDRKNREIFEETHKELIKESNE